MENQSPEIIVSGIHLDLTPSLKTHITDKAARLVRHEAHIVRLRVELECDSKVKKGPLFIAKAQLQLRGMTIAVSSDSEDMHKSIDLLMDRLDHALRRRHGQRKDKRNHPSATEFAGVAFPKAV